MNYNLNHLPDKDKKVSTFAAFKNLLQLISNEKRNVVWASLAILINSALNLLSPFLIGYTIDRYIQTKQFDGVLLIALVLLMMYIAALVTSYLQTQLMGSIGQRMLFTLRNTLFNKLQQLPLDFFNQNKTGDLISRINNDTDKLNQFFSQSLVQFIGSLVSMLGAGIFLLIINTKLGSATLIPAVFILIFTLIISPIVKRKNAKNLKSVGGMSGQIQESLNNFKVIIAFNRRDYFRSKFKESNQQNYKTAIGAGLMNNLFLPVFGLFSNLAQLIVLVFGIYLIINGEFTIGFLISYLAYATNFYNPLRQLATLWANFQVAMASWDRISQILSLSTNLTIEQSDSVVSSSFLEFKDVYFSYTEGKEILHRINFSLEKGKTYALIGPTGGGKTTTASLMARLYDPTKGTVSLSGKDIKSYSPEERASKIGFILQDPFLFTGTVKDNILYGNELYQNYSNDQLIEILKENNLEKLLSVFEDGLDTAISSGGESISLGQKQLIAFMRAVLRKPELLILDEATANIDTITEQSLHEILEQLPIETTRVIIAHRLNTIENADEIFFINSGNVIRAGSLDDAVEKLLKDKRMT